MELRNKGGIFYAASSYEERRALKEARFLWHGGNCRPNCRACQVGLGKVWWTAIEEIAYRLRPVADEATGEILDAWHEKRRSATEESQAAVADIAVPAPEGLSYRPYQLAGIRYASQRDATLLADEPGLGKTIQALGLISLEGMRRVLAIVPANLRLNWAREAQRWLLGRWRIHVLGTGLKRWAKRQNGAHRTTVGLNPEFGDDENILVIVNYERARTNSCQQILMAQQWDLLVTDECHRLKNPKAKQTKACLGFWDRRRREEVPGYRHRARKLLFLSGTPIRNKVQEMHSVLSCLHPSFRNWQRFVTRYAGAYRSTVARGRTVWQFSGPQNLGELRAKLRETVMVRRLKADVLQELPEKERQLVAFLPEDPNARRAVEAQKEALRAGPLGDIVDLLEQGTKTGYRDAVAKMARNTKRLVFSEYSKEREAVALAKLPQVLEHLDALLEESEENSEKVVVFAHHRSVLEAIHNHFGDASVLVYGGMAAAERQAAVDRFQEDDTCRVFTGSITAAGEGITLTAASLLVFAELSWVPAEMSQCEDRIHRIGQHWPCLCQYLVLEGSFDQVLAEMLVGKELVSEEVLDKPVKGAPAAPEPTVSEEDHSRPEDEDADPEMEARLEYIHAPEYRTSISEDAPSVQAFMRLVERLVEGEELGAEVRLAGRCARCGRLLTTPESVDTGLGPYCAKKVGFHYGISGGGFTSPDGFEAFLLSGNAYFTAGEYTYRVVRSNADVGEGKAIYWASVLTGPRNTTDYTFFGGLLVEERE